MTTYKDLALALGDADAARAVGTILSNNPHPVRYPCWRVVYSDGRVGNYSGEGGAAEKKRLMKQDGIPIRNNSVEEFDQRRFHSFQIDPALPRLRNVQKNIAESLTTEPLCLEEITTIGGVDLAYKTERKSIGAYVEIDRESLQVNYETTITRSISFPYIATYLAFRELPTLRPLLGQGE